MTATDVDLQVDNELEEEQIPVEFDIATYPSDFTLSGIHQKWTEGDIQIPEFQRQFVWKIQQSSLLIDSFLVGLPVPPVFFYIDEENKNLVIDGQQRILSVIYFFEGFFGEESATGKRQVFRLTGLDERSRYRNLRYEDLTDSDQRKLSNAVLRAINIRQLSPRGENTSIFHIFERLNTGGTALKPQEIRNCVFRGELVKHLRTLNDDGNWRVIMGNPAHDKHQRDVELTLRMFALSGNWRTYEKPMKEYLNVAMRRHRDGGSDVVKRFVERFPQVCERIVNDLGHKPFHVRGPLNASVLDAVFVTILDGFEDLPADLGARFKRLLQTETFLEGTYASTTNTAILRKRLAEAHSVLIGA